MKIKKFDPEAKLRDKDFVARVLFENGNPTLRTVAKVLHAATH